MSFVLFALFFFLLHKSSISLAQGLGSYLIILFLGFVAGTIPAGYILSFFDGIGSPFLWAITTSVLAGLFFLGVYLFGSPKAKRLEELIAISIRNGKSMWAGCSKWEKLTFGILGLGLVICTSINLLVLFMSYPNEWDSMTGHLVKCAYYIQNGNMDRLGGTTWSIDFYPNSLPTLQILGFHIFGEKGFKLIHFLSYWAFVLTSYEITKEIFTSKKGAVFVGLMAALLPTALIQAVTTETDIVQSAYLGLVVYFLLKVYRNASWQNIILFVLSTSVWVSHKVTFLLIGPAVAVLVLYMFWKSEAIRKKSIATILLMLVGFSIYVIPNGYIANVKEVGKFSLGALSAPAEVMKWHGIEGYSTGEKLKNFQFNVLRYSSDFLQLDGIRNTDLGAEINNSFRFIPNKVFDKFGLERGLFWVVYPFEMMGDKQMHFYKERPYWGIISFMMVLPAIFFVFLFRKRKTNSEEVNMSLIFIIAGLLHFLSLCFSAPYDPIKARYFMNMCVWFLPLLAWFFHLTKGRMYLAFCSIVIVITGILTLTHRGLYPLVGENNIFELDRIAQLNVTRPEGTEAYQKFDELVPKDAIVALAAQQEHEDYVYPLWGKDFERKLIPIHPFRAALKPIPKDAEYLFYSEGVVEYQEGDIQLNEGDILKDSPVPDSKFFLRKL